MSEAQLKALLLPEILHLIFEHLAREAEGSSRERALTARAALARCARVNKLWSPLALRYLWRRAGYQGSEVLKVHNLLAKIHYRPGAACGFSDEKGCRQYYASFVKETAVFTYLREWEQEIETIEGVLREVTFMNLETLVVTAIPRTWKFYLPLLDCPRLRILVINLPGVLCGRSPSHGAYSNRLRANVYIDLVSDIVDMFPTVRILRLLDPFVTLKDEHLDIIRQGEPRLQEVVSLRGMWDCHSGGIKEVNQTTSSLELDPSKEEGH